MRRKFCSLSTVHVAIAGYLGYTSLFHGVPASNETFMLSFLLRSKLPKFDENRLIDKFLLFNIKINNEDYYVLLSKTSFSDSLDGIMSKIFLGQPPNPDLAELDYL